VFNKRVHLLVKRILMLLKCTVRQLKKCYSTLQPIMNYFKVVCAVHNVEINTQNLPYMRWIYTHRLHKISYSFCGTLWLSSGSLHCSSVSVFEVVQCKKHFQTISHVLNDNFESTASTTVKTP